MSVLESLSARGPTIRFCPFALSSETKATDRPPVDVHMTDMHVKMGDVGVNDDLELSELAKERAPMARFRGAR